MVVCLKGIVIQLVDDNVTDERGSTASFSKASRGQTESLPRTFAANRPAARAHNFKILF